MTLLCTCVSTNDDVLASSMPKHHQPASTSIAGGAFTTAQQPETLPFDVTHAGFLPLGLVGVDPSPVVPSASIPAWVPLRKPYCSASYSMSGGQLAIEEECSWEAGMQLCRYSNVILARPDGEILLCAYQVGSKMSSARQLQTGGRYQLPPKPQGIPPDLAESFDSWKHNVCQAAQMVSTKSSKTASVADGMVRAYQVTHACCVISLVRRPHTTL